MNKGQRTIAGLLTIIAVLMALNLLVKATPPAEAQTVEIPTVAQSSEIPIEPKAVAMAIHEPLEKAYVFRMWDDGSVDLTLVDVNASAGGDTCASPHPNTGRCWTIPILDACMADSNWDGEVGFSDLLNVLSYWGPCP